MELRTSITRQIEYSEVVEELEPGAEAEIPEVPEIVKSGFQCSWLAHILRSQTLLCLRVKTLKSFCVKISYKLIWKNRKLTTKAEQAQLLEVKMEQKRQNNIQEELIRKQEALEKRMHEQHLETIRKQEEMAKKQEELERNMQKQLEETMAEQSKTNAGIASILEMMKKQQQS